VIVYMGNSLNCLHEYPIIAESKKMEKTLGRIYFSSYYEVLQV
jgi:hypothetical protein